MATEDREHEISDSRGADRPAKAAGPAPASFSKQTGRDRAAIVVWSLATLLLGVPFSLALWQHSFGPPKSLNDFVQEWTSARNYFQGEPVYAPLDESVHRHFQRDLRLGIIRHNAHPPASVMITLPFCKFPYELALKLWNAASLAAMVAAILLLFSSAGLGGSSAWPGWHVLPVFTLLVTSNSLAQQMLQGQLNLVLLLLFTGFWIAARQQRWLLSGALVGMAGAIKLFPLYLGLYFLGRRRWRGVVGVGIGFVLLNGGALLLFGWEAFETFLVEVTPEVAGEFQAYWPNASLSGFFRKNLDGDIGHVKPLADLPSLAAALSLGAALIVTVVAGLQCWTAETRDEQDRAMATCAISMLLASPITWDHYFVVLVPFLAVLWVQTRTTGARVALLTLIVVLFFVRPTWIWNAVIPGDGELADLPGQTPSVAESWHGLTVLSYQLYGLLALWLMSVSTLWTTRRESSGCNRAGDRSWDGPPASAAAPAGN